MCTISDFRDPSFSITLPTLSAGNVHQQPLDRLAHMPVHWSCTAPWARPPGIHNPPRRIVSIRIERCISPRPSTRNDSALSVSCTASDTSLRSSLISRSRKCRDVTNFPSRPAKGLSLTENVISTVGSEIFTNGIGSNSSVYCAHTVLPMLTFPRP